MGDCACHANDLHLKWDGTNLAFAFLELTPICNNRCQGCSNVFANDRPRTPLSGREWIQLIERIQPSVRWLKLTGGEPTMHPDLAMIVDFLNQRHLPFRLLTNGRWPHLEQTLATLASSSTLESLLISLHGPDEPSHEAFSNVPGSFGEAVSTISRAAQAGLKVTVSTVITRYNWNRVSEMAHFALGLGATHTAFNRYIGAPLPELEATPQQTMWAIEEVEELVSQGAPVRFGTPVPQCFFPNSTMPCMAGKAFITVDPWGNVRPCNHAELVIGNLLRDSLVNLMSSPLLKQWQMDIPAVCSSCDLVTSCGAGCRAMHRWQKETDSFVFSASLHGYQQDKVLAEECPPR